MTAAAPSKHAHIETIRGLACVLLVAFHVVGNDSDHGLHIAEPGPWHFFIELFSNVRMPLFSFISGLVFAVDPRTFVDYRRTLAKKARRLLLPLISVSTLFWLTTALIGSRDVPPLWTIYLLTYEHFWFLQATMTIMAILLTLGFLLNGGRRVATLAFLPLVALFLIAPDFRYDVFGINQTFYLAPYFIAGYLLRTWGLDRTFLAEPPTRAIAVALFGLAAGGLLALQAAVLLGAVDMGFGRQTLPGLALGLSSCLFLLALRPVVPTLAWIGNRSFAIYLFHVFFTSAARNLMGAIDPDAARLLVFTVALGAGLLVPALLERLILRSPPAALVFLGIDLKRRSANAPAQAEATTAPTG